MLSWKVLIIGYFSSLHHDELGVHRIAIMDYTHIIGIVSVMAREL
jgi:hypothetical protein